MYSQHGDEHTAGAPRAGRRARAHGHANAVLFTYYDIYRTVFSQNSKHVAMPVRPPFNVYLASVHGDSLPRIGTQHGSRHDPPRQPPHYLGAPHVRYGRTCAARSILLADSETMTREEITVTTHTYVRAFT